MDDPNVVYKRAFAALQEKLGRVPGVQDAEWLVIGNEYSRGWAPAEETECVVLECVSGTKDQTAITPVVSAGKFSTVTGAANPGPTTTITRARNLESPGSSEAPAREAPTPSLPLSGPGTNPTGGKAETVPAAGSGAGWNSQRATSGRRGSSGGILAQCVVCGQEWERGKVRGRPSVKCERCR